MIQLIPDPKQKILRSWAGGWKRRRVYKDVRYTTVTSSLTTGRLEANKAISMGVSRA